MDVTGSSVKTLQVNVDRIPDEGLTIQAQEPADSFPPLKDAARGEAFRFDAPLQMEIRLRRVSNFVETSGRIRTTVHLTCSRCLGGYAQALSIPFEATYSEEASTPEASGEGAEIELTTEAIDLFPFRGRDIDLSDAVSEQVLLALPFRPLCREGCKGLCPRCGANLNQGVCECTEQPVDSRFAVLKNLKIDDR